MRKNLLPLCLMPLLVIACRVVEVPITHIESSQNSIPAEVRQISVLTYEYPRDLPPDLEYVREQIADEIRNQLKDIGYQIVERENLREMIEKRISSEAATETNHEENFTVPEIDAIIRGKVETIALEDRMEKIAGPQGREYDYLFRKLTMTVSSEMLRISDSKTIVATQFHYLYNSETDKKVIAPEGIYTDKNNPAYYEEQPGRVPAINTIIEQAARQCARNFIEHLSGEEVEFIIPLKNGSSAPMDLGLDYAERGLYQDAISQFERAIAEDGEAALYNIGVCYEALGNYSAAIENYQRSNFDEAREGLARIRRFHPDELSD